MNPTPHQQPYDDDFDNVIQGGYHTTSPYAEPEFTAPPARIKPGLTKRGRIAIAVVSVAVAGTGFFMWQSHSAQVAKDQKEAAAFDLQMKKLELEEMKIRNAQKTQDSKVQAAVQEQVDKCVKDSADLVGKGYGSPSKSDVIADCQRQYSTAADGSDMAAAGSATDSSTGGGINASALLGLAAGGGLLVAVAANRGRRNSNAA
ncbi:MAG: hypothetical protein HOY75_08020 [Streptomyces sp.]|nr:hypothetical protein [Streptomyces sp.]